jgi:hypothetical protein
MTLDDGGRLMSLLELLLVAAILAVALRFRPRESSIDRTRRQTRVDAGHRDVDLRGSREPCC